MNEQFRDGWRQANEALIKAIAPLTPAQLATQVYPPAPIWGSVAHMAGARVYWLCRICKEPGIERTPFTSDEGWEDDLSHPRRADELVEALRTTWDVVEDVLGRWSEESFGQEVRMTRADGAVRIHTRGSILWRMITHDAFHIGEISAAMGTHKIGPNAGNGPIDLWIGLSRPG